MPSITLIGFQPRNLEDLTRIRVVGCSQRQFAGASLLPGFGAIEVSFEKHIVEVLLDPYVLEDYPDVLIFCSELPFLDLLQPSFERNEQLQAHQSFGTAGPLKLFGLHPLLEQVFLGDGWLILNRSQIHVLPQSHVLPLLLDQLLLHLLQLLLKFIFLLTFRVDIVCHRPVPIARKLQLLLDFRNVSQLCLHMRIVQYDLGDGLFDEFELLQCVVVILVFEDEVPVLGLEFEELILVDGHKHLGGVVDVAIEGREGLLDGINVLHGRLYVIDGKSDPILSNVLVIQASLLTIRISLIRKAVKLQSSLLVLI